MVLERKKWCIYIHQSEAGGENVKGETSRDQGSGICVKYLLPSNWNEPLFPFTILSCSSQKHLRYRIHQENIMTVSATKHWFKLKRKKGLMLGILLDWYLSDCCGKKTETKCKDEEDHRFFAERPFSYGDFVLIHLHIIILVVTCCFWLRIKKFANLY